MKKEVKICALATVLILICTMVLQLILPLSAVKAHTDAGDVSKDGILNIADVVQLRIAIINNIDLGGTPKLGDINEDGLVDITDVMLLKRAIVNEVKVSTTDRTNLQIGDYVDYTPDTATAYSKNNLVLNFTGSSANTADITQENLKWQILRKYDDGSMDLIGSSTTQGIAFDADVGYNNGVYIMNDVCKSLYSKSSEGIIARSVNIKDYEYWLTNDGNLERHSSPNYLKVLEYTNSHKPDIYGKAEDISDSYYTSLAFHGNTTGQAYELQQTGYSLAINETNYREGYKALNGGGTTWVASRYNYSDAFGLYQSGQNIGPYTRIYWPMGGYDGGDQKNGFRPVVNIPANMKISVSTTASTATGTPHTITDYGDAGISKSNLYIGDYVDYTPDTATAYSKNNLVLNYTGSSANTADITQENLKWQILRKYSDGSMDLIGSTTSQSITFDDDVGYNNGVYIMNDMCKLLYSKSSEGIEARSVNINDYEYWLTDAGKATRDADPDFMKSTPYTNSHKPDIYGKAEDISDSYYTSLSYHGSTGGETYNLRQIGYNMIVNSTNYGEGSKVLFGGGWVASRFNHIGYFGLYYSNGNAIRDVDMYYPANVNGGDYGFGLRPVVKLPADAKVALSSTASSSTGTPHTITQY